MRADSAPPRSQATSRSRALLGLTNEVFILNICRPLIHEPDASLPYNLSTSINEFLESRKENEFDLSLEMEQFYLKDIKNGFFIEAGAAEG